jgi:hypothetical protein
VAGLLRRTDLAIDIIAGEIRSAQYEVLLDAARMVLSSRPVVAIARQLREAADTLMEPKGYIPKKRR